jgi:uncharacterized protein (TIGR03437 family)
MLFNRTKILLALLGSTIGTGSLFATSNLLTITAPVSLTEAISCSTTTGLGAAASVTVHNPSTTTSVTIQSLKNLPAGVSVTSPSLPVTVAASGNQTVTFNYAAGCAGAGLTSSSGTLSGTGAVAFMVGAVSPGASDATLTSVTYTYTVGTTSPLTISPSPIAITCMYNGSTYSPNVPTVKIITTANGGTPFTVASAPGWLSVTAGTATTTGLTASITPTCTGAVGSSMSGTVTLSSYTGLTKSVTVNMQVVGPAPLTVSAAAAKTYVKNSENFPSWTVNVSSTTGLYFTVDPTSLPSWLTANAMSGNTTSGPVSITFSTTAVLDSLTAGAQTAAVAFKVAGYANTALAITVNVSNPSSTLTVEGTTVQNLTWVQGQPLPVAEITLVSSDAPIPFTISTGGIVQLATSSSGAPITSGVGYSFGATIPVAFKLLSFSQAQPGNVLNGTETISWGSSNSIVITFNVTVQSGSTTAALTAISPTNLPTAQAGQTFAVTLYGSGFVPGTDPTQRTNVGIVSGGAIMADAAISNLTVGNSTSLSFSITVPSSDPLLPWSGNQNVTIGVCNPGGGTCSVPTGTITLMIGAGPIISSVSAASTGIVNPNIAPYDIISLWGYNFCSSNGSGCTANQVLYGSPDPVTFAYPTVNGLSPDAGQRKLTVTFTPHGATTPVYYAPLLFATNTQINLLVPGELTATTQYDIVVNFGYGASGSPTLLSSSAYTLTAAATDPGIFTLNQDGTGDAAVLKSSNYSVVSTNNPVSLSAVTGGTSDSISIYGTGLGTPTYTLGNCISIANYQTLSGAANSDLDGVVIQPSLLSSNGANSLPPCFNPAAGPTVKIGNVAVSTLSYAGWAPDSVAGLYQLNVTLPAAPTATTFTDASGGAAHSLVSPVLLPLTVALGGNTGPTTATVWAVPSLKLTSSGSTTGSVQTGFASTPTVTVTGGTGPYTITCANASLCETSGTATEFNITTTSPAITFAKNAVTTAKGVYLMTVNASDSSTPAITGSATVALTVTDSSDTSTVTATATPVTSSVFGTPNIDVTTITAGGGTGPYTYAFASPVTGISISSSGVVTTSATAGAGYYNMDVTVTDSDSNTRDIYFDIPIALALSSSNGTYLSGTASAANSNLTTISATGASSVGYALLNTNLGGGCTAAISGSGVLSTGSCPAGTYFATVIVTDQASASAPFNPASTRINVSIKLQ